VGRRSPAKSIYAGAIMWAEELTQSQFSASILCKDPLQIPSMNVQESGQKISSKQPCSLNMVVKGARIWAEDIQ